MLLVGTPGGDTWLLSTLECCRFPFLYEVLGVWGILLCSLFLSSLCDILLLSDEKSAVNLTEGALYLSCAFRVLSLAFSSLMVTCLSEDL